MVVFVSAEASGWFEYLIGAVGLIDCCWACWLQHCKGSVSEPQLPFVLLSVSMCVDPWDCECAALGGGAPQGTFSLAITKGRRD